MAPPVKFAHLLLPLLLPLLLLLLLPLRLPLVLPRGHEAVRDRMAEKGRGSRISGEARRSWLRGWSNGR
jgi:hypothetical protein